MIRPAIGALALCLALAGAEAKPLFMRGGHPGLGPPPDPPEGQACDGGSSVCALHQNGQTFVTWTDLAIGSEGNNHRYWLHRSTSPLNPGNYSGAPVVASYIPNNSSYLISGNPDILGGATYTQANRQNPASENVPLTDMGPPLPHGTGLQVATTPSNGNYYYAVVAKPCPSGVCTAGPDVYIGAVGPIAETVADPKPIKIRDSFSRIIASNFGKLTVTEGMPIAFVGHGSSGNGGSPGRSQYGDYWVWFIPAEDGYNWNDGVMTPLVVLREQDGRIEMRSRDTLLNPLGTGGLETFHNGIGMTPNPLIGPANRRYIGTANAYKRMFQWAIDHYGLDPLEMHWSGQSMGAMGGGLTGMRMNSPKMSGLWLSMGMYKMYTRTVASIAGATWGSWPHRGTVAPAPNTLGTDPTAILLPDGSPYGGVGSYSDSVSYVCDDLAAEKPVMFFNANKDDSSIAAPDFQWAQQKEMWQALNDCKRGGGFVWAMGNHDKNAIHVFSCIESQAIPGVCVPRGKLRYDAMFPAFSNSSIDDDWGTGTRNAFGIMDGDPHGCRNCGHQWTVVSDTSGGISFTVSNGWMNRNPTPAPTTTFSAGVPSSGSATVAVASGAGWQSGTQYAVIDDKEIVSGTMSGNNLNITGRGLLGTTAQSHPPGATVRQYRWDLSGPNNGPFTDMTVDITPRRIQNFTKGKTNGQVISCTITSHGDSPVVQTPTVADGIFTLTDVQIIFTGPTTIECS